MPAIITIPYSLLVTVYVAMGAAIVFHMLYYKINRHAAFIMFLIYIIGAVLLLLSNIILLRSVDWYQIISNFGF
jgi:hypothetical protein